MADDYDRVIAREALEAELQGMNDRQKSVALGNVLRGTCTDCEEIMSPAAICSALLSTYVEFGRERLGAPVLAIHLRGIIEALECPPH